MTAGSPVHVRVTVRNRGPCVSARGLALCYVKRIAPGATVTLLARASTRLDLSRLRLVAAADATEPERLVRNNLATARVRMRRPPAEPCVAAAQEIPLARAAC